MIHLSGNLSNTSVVPHWDRSGINLSIYLSNCPIVPCLRCQPFEDFVPFHTLPSLRNIGSVPWGLSFHHITGLPASSKALVASLAKTHCLCCGHFEIKVKSDRWRPLFFQPQFSVSLHNLDTYWPPERYQELSRSRFRSPLETNRAIRGIVFAETVPCALRSVNICPAKLRRGTRWYSHRTNVWPNWESFINVSCEWIQNHPPSTAPPTFNSEFHPIMKLPWFSGSEETLISTAQDSASTPKALSLDATIPPALPGRARTLILCFDGTGDKCVHLFHCLKRTDIG